MGHFCNVCMHYCCYAVLQRRITYSRHYTQIEIIINHISGCRSHIHLENNWERSGRDLDNKKHKCLLCSAQA